MKHAAVLPVLLILCGSLCAQVKRVGDTTPVNSNRLANFKADTVASINAMYNKMEENIELQYAKLIGEARDEAAALQDKIRQLEKQVSDLKQEIKNIESQIARTEQAGGLAAAVKTQELKNQIEAKNKAIHSLQQQIKSLKAQIAAIESEIAKLQLQKQKALAELQKQRQKAIRAAKR